ncbi:Histidine phosphatase superfamily [Fusarium oxysporum f. sp. vasinfectum]|nr:Histidine phosphatase superfamily [Fusarium oxysporum f. sp. vasinfectum]
MEKERYISFLQRLTKISKRIMISQQTPAAGGNLQKSYSTKEYIDFIWRGLQYANQLIGCQEFNDDDWQIDHWFSTEGQEDWCHKFEIIPRNSFEKKTFRTFASIKYTHSAFKEIAVQAGLKVTKADEHNDTGMVAYQLEPEAIICRLVFCRHEEAISNLKLSDGLDIRKMSVQESKKLNEKLQTNTIDGDRIGLGDFWPDGLTQYGKIQATTRSLNLLENVYEVISSSSLRAMQTAFCMDGNFEKVGSRYDKNNQMLIRYDGRIREATNWPQDQAAIIKEEGCRKYASYIKVQGGNGHDKPSGTILGVETVDLTNTMPFGKYEDVTTISTMLESLKRPRKIEEIEEEVAQFISDLLRRALEIASEHKASGRKGNPHIVIVTHGGILNFIMNDWNCKFKESSDGMCLEWCESTNLENGDAVVCEFSNSSNRLREIPGDTYYKRIFGSHYRNLTEEKANLAESHNAEGSICNQRQEHLNFIERTADDVAATPTEALEVVWSGILRGKPRE